MLFDSSEFLGCTSFGIRHLINPRKDTDGWYYLLTEEVGRKKHLKVSSKNQPKLQVRSKSLFFICYLLIFLSAKRMSVYFDTKSMYVNVLGWLSTGHINSAKQYDRSYI